ncbi:K02A2.6-like [Cordylochernes scorpioides]|uniref:K02A2.6-like n=1 Tax=Cordylochernes scorpioides TaxID=51811 RepID=A0ABY6KTK4_9ARAC|nr:K02A2.6-like [Cordylochernes scorpioides]
MNCRYCGSNHRKASCPAYANQTLPLECQLDSGSTCNIMSQDDYRRSCENEAITCTYPMQGLKFLNQLSIKYEGVLKGLGMLPKEYHIEIEKEATPVQQHPRRIPIGVKAEFKRKLNDLEERGIIERVQNSSSWISNLVLVKKQNKLRVCVDPRDLNKLVKIPHYQIPTIEEILLSLNNAKILTVIDAKDGFWKIKLDSQSSELTTF